MWRYAVNVDSRNHGRRRTCVAILLVVALVSFMASPANAALSVKRTDVNNDGHADVLGVDATTGVLHKWYGDANGGLTYQGTVGGGWVAPDGGARYFELLFVGDINGDARHAGDIVGFDFFTRGLHRWYGTGAGGFTDGGEFNNGWDWFESDWILSPGDLDRNGIADLLSVDGYGVMHRWFGDGVGGFYYGGNLGNGWGREAWLELVGVGDINRDGVGDWVGTTYDGIMYRWYGSGTHATGSGGFVRGGPLGRGWGPYFLCGPGDVNGDGVADLLGVNADHVMYEWYGNGNGGFTFKRVLGGGWIYALLP